MNSISTKLPFDLVPLSPRAKDFYETVFKPRLDAMQAQVAQTPLGVLVWGPGPNNTDLYAKRLQIRNELRTHDIAAFFSEDLSSDNQSQYSQKGIEFLEATVADLVVVLQVSFGSIAEVHDFADYSIINKKMLIFVSDTAIDGYSYQGALTELKALFNNVETFHIPDDLTSCRLKTIVLEKVRHMQMLKWRATQNAVSWGL